LGFLFSAILCLWAWPAHAAPVGRTVDCVAQTITADGDTHNSVDGACTMIVGAGGSFILRDVVAIVAASGPDNAQGTIAGEPVGRMERAAAIGRGVEVVRGAPRLSSRGYETQSKPDDLAVQAALPQMLRSHQSVGEEVCAGEVPWITVSSGCVFDCTSRGIRDFCE
jgi:hypothetical protein